MKETTWILAMTIIALTAASARADESSESSRDGVNDYGFGIALTIGEGMYFIERKVYRGPVSIEVVPSIGWSWVKIDLGLSTTLESIRVAGTRAGYWNFTFRPGARLTPPMLPLYARIAFPLEIQRHDFDWGVMFGVGVDIHLVSILGLVIEADTTLSDRLEWSGAGIPLEFRVGISLHH